MDLKKLCDEIRDMREEGFCFENAEQIAGKVVEELQEVREALQSKDLIHLEEEIGDLIQATLVLCDFLGFRGDKALGIAFSKLQTRYKKYKKHLEKESLDLRRMPFKDRSLLWQRVKKEEASL